MSVLLAQAFPTSQPVSSRTRFELEIARLIFDPNDPGVVQLAGGAIKHKTRDAALVVVTVAGEKFDLHVLPLNREMSLLLNNNESISHGSPGSVAPVGLVNHLSDRADVARAGFYISHYHAALIGNQEVLTRHWSLVHNALVPELRDVTDGFHVSLSTSGQPDMDHLVSILLHPSNDDPDHD